MQSNSDTAPDLVASIIPLLLSPVRQGADLMAIADVCERLRAVDVRTISPLVRMLRNVGSTDAILLESVIGTITRDLRHYARLLEFANDMMETAPLDALHHLYWCIQRQMFLMRMDLQTSPHFMTERMFPFYERFVGEVARRLNPSPAPRWRDAPSRERVVLATNQFLSGGHQPTRDLLSYAKLLQEHHGKEVLILNTNMLPNRGHTGFVPPFNASMATSLNGFQRVKFEDHIFFVLSSTEQSITAEKIGGFMRAVEEFDPDIVVSFGGSVVVADLLASTRPTLCIPTTSDLTISLSDIVLGYGGASPPLTDGRLAASWRPFRFRFSLRGEPGRAARADFSIPEDAFACVIVGNRLDIEVDDRFVRILEEILDRIPRGLVLLAGEVASLSERLARSRHAGALRCLGHVSDIRGLLSVCDVFLNPQRTGGGGSVAHALVEGVVPISFTNGDVASVVGAAFTVPDHAAYVNRAVALAGAPDLLAQAREEARQRYTFINESDTDTALFTSYMDEAVRLFRERTGA